MGGVASTPGPGSQTAAPVIGMVVDAAGRPAAGVKIAAFKSDELPAGSIGGLIGNVGGGLIGNAGGGLIGNAGGGLVGAPSGGRSRRIAAVSGTTGADGRYEFRPDADGQYNLEAESTQTKAWKFKLAVARAATQSLTLTLAPTGALAGKVVVKAASASIVVWIPGSVYWVYAGADGAYRLENLPPGKFEVHAWASGYRIGGVLGADYKDPLVVRSGETTTVPDLTLSAEASPSG
jgi:hypothetical protein